MKLHILFGQRKENYAGEYAPEALAVADELTVEQNPEYLQEELESNRDTGEFESLAIAVVSVPASEIMALLRPSQEISGKVCV